MAKLSARGRAEILRLVNGDKVYAFMSDGHVLHKEHKGDSWTDVGRVKAGLSINDVIGIYGKLGYKEGKRAPLPFAWGRKPSDRIPLASEPIMSERKAATLKRSRERGALKRKAAAEAEARRSGEGFYVRNRHMGGDVSGKLWVAELGPYETLDEARDKAYERLRSFVQMKLDYLLPVQVVYAKTRTRAEQGDFSWVGPALHVYWQNGVNRGEPVDPRQMKLFG